MPELCTLINFLQIRVRVALPHSTMISA